MIRYVSGDILKTKCKAIVHGVAPNDDFKRGLALALREHWPALYKDFRHFAQTKHPKPGTLWTWSDSEITVVNLFTQEGSEGHQAAHGGKATIGHVNHCFKALRQEIQGRQIKSLAVPRIATGVGGLDWKDVHPIIKEHLADLETSVVIYEKYVPSHTADEGI